MTNFCFITFKTCWLRFCVTVSAAHEIAGIMLMGYVNEIVTLLNRLTHAHTLLRDGDLASSKVLKNLKVTKTPGKPENE